jgi:hypothetical protein
MWESVGGRKGVGGRGVHLVATVHLAIDAYLAPPDRRVPDHGFFKGLLNLCRPDGIFAVHPVLIAVAVVVVELQRRRRTTCRQCQRR